VDRAQKSFGAPEGSPLKANAEHAVERFRKRTLTHDDAVVDR
jgi:hypothetical protein